MDTTETITVKGQDGKPLRINATDFKVGTHELYDDDGSNTDDKGGNGSSGGENGGQTIPPAQQPAQQPNGQPAGAAAPRGAAKPA